MALLYFAYGSNMHPGRLRHRIDAAVPRGIARLPGHRLVFHKRGADGSGKGDVVPTHQNEVWGVLYELTDAHAERLDAIEGAGYARAEIEVIGIDGEAGWSAFTYRARLDAIGANLEPFTWYLDFLVQGALHHGLPEHYVAQLRRVATRVDSHAARVRREMEKLSLR